MLDSDKEFPADTLGDTAAAAQFLKNISLYPTLGIIETTGREMENMVHDAFFSRWLGADPNHQSGLKILRFADQSNDLEIRLHYDFKKGLLLGPVLKLSANDGKRVFWEQKFLVLESILNHRHTRFACTEIMTCSSGTCMCRLSNGFGTHILKTFITDFDRFGETKVAAEIPVSLRDEWKRIGQFLFDWGCARDRVRA